ncbi:hypothetical protein N7540_000280 [Penicillium herquei]|nr:hypothetical protein N7540_000280 [Penicillium herquei]
MGSPKVVGLGSVATYTPLSDDLSNDPTIQSIQAALAGGPATQQYFQKVNNFGQLFGQLSKNGSAAWTTGSDSSIQYDGQPAPVMYVDLVDGYGKPYYIKVAAANISVDNSGNVDPNGTQQTINGTTYNGIGTIEMTVGYDNYQYSTTSWWVGTSIGGLVVASIVLPYVFKAVKAAANTLADQIKAMTTSPDAAEGGEETEAAEETEDAGGYESIADEAGVDIAALEGAEEGAAIALGDVFIGVGIVLAVVFIILSFVLHSTYQSVRLWNLTSYTLNWSLWFDTGELIKGPVIFNDDNSIQTYEPISPVSHGSPIPGVDPTNSAYYADLNFISSSEFSAVGYVLTANLVDENNVTQYTATIGYDIPYSGENMVKISMDSGIGDPGTWYSSINSNDETTSAGASSSDQNISTTATYDYLNGEHPVPGTDPEDPTNEKYFYQSLVLIEQNDLEVSVLRKTSPRTKAPPKPSVSTMLRGLKPSIRRNVRNALHMGKLAGLN